MASRIIHEGEHPAVKSRDEAVASGERHYYTGKPCKYGHVAKRLVSTRQCMECKRENSRRQYAEDPESASKRRREWYANNRDYARERRRDYYKENRDLCVEYAREYRKKNPQKVAESNAKSRLLNRESRNAYSRKWHADNREHSLKYKREYYAENRDQEISRARENYAADPEKHRGYTRRYNLRNPGYKKRWRMENPDKVRAQDRNRRARIKGSTGRHTASDVRRIYKLQKGRCAYCSAKLGEKYHADHITPLAKGGDNGPENIALSCPSCNLSKAAKMPHVFAREIGRLL